MTLRNVLIFNCGTGVRGAANVYNSTISANGPILSPQNVQESIIWPQGIGSCSANFDYTDGGDAVHVPCGTGNISVNPQFTNTGQCDFNPDGRLSGADRRSHGRPHRVARLPDGDGVLGRLAVQRRQRVLDRHVQPRRLQFPADRRMRRVHDERAVQRRQRMHDGHVRLAGNVRGEPAGELQRRRRVHDR